MPTQRAPRAPRSLLTERMFAQRFSATRRGARLARLLTLHQLDEWGFPYGSGPSETAGAVVAELAANAVLHGRVPGRDFALSLTCSATALLVEVTDTRDDARPPAQPPSPPTGDDESGRGLLLVSALASAWGVRPREPRSPGKTVWAVVPLLRGASRTD